MNKVTANEAKYVVVGGEGVVPEAGGLLNSKAEQVVLQGSGLAMMPISTNTPNLEKKGKSHSMTL